MTMCMLLSATSTHFKWELVLHCLHCPTLNKVFLLLLFLLLGNKNYNVGMANTFGSDWVSGSHFVLKTSKFLLIIATAGHWVKVTNMCPSTFSQTYTVFVLNIWGLPQMMLMWEAKVVEVTAGAETNWKHKVNPDRGDLKITLIDLNCLVPQYINPNANRRGRCTVIQRDLSKTTSQSVLIHNHVKKHGQSIWST